MCLPYLKFSDPKHTYFFIWPNEISIELNGIAKTIHKVLSVACTVHPPYFGSKKPLGGFYHCKNIGSFFLIFLDKYGIKLYLMIFPIILCGVEDSVENYQTYLISCCAVMVFESYGILFFFVLSRSLS